MIRCTSRTILGDIPTDWATIPLRKALAYHKAGDWGDERGEVVCKVLRSTNFRSDGSIDFSDVALRCLTQKSAETLTLKANDLLLERSGGGPTQPVGRIVFVREDLPGHSFSNFVQLLRPNPRNIHPGFLGWVLYELNRVGVTQRLQHQTTQMRNLEYRDYLTVELPKPPECEQERIAKAIDTADLAVKQTEVEHEAAQRLKHSLLQQLFSAGVPGNHRRFKGTKWLTTPLSWSVKTLGELAEVKSGFTMGRDLSRHATVRVPYVTVVHVQDGHLDLKDLPTVDIKSSELETGTLKAGDVLMTEGGDRDKLGRGAIWKGEVVQCAYQNHIFRIRFKDKSYDPNLFHYLIQSWQSKNYFFGHAKQTNNLCTINSRELKRYPIGMPDPGEQKVMLELLDSADQALNRLRIKVEALKCIKRSLLQNLLTGLIRLS